MTAATTVSPGDELPTAVRFTTTAQLVRYAGAADDYSGIHYDDRYARERGFENVIVHGFLKAAFLAELAMDWATELYGAGCWFRRFAVRYRGTDLVGRPIVCRGRVTEVDGEHVTIELWTEKADGTTTTTATGTLQLPARAR